MKRTCTLKLINRRNDPLPARKIGGQWYVLIPEFEVWREEEHIRNFNGSKSGLVENFNNLNFWEIKYKDAKGEYRPEYIMTKDGFTLLSMGFTGKKAMEFKIAYIERFNAMESFIKSLISTKHEYPAFTEAVLMAHEEPKHYHFSNEVNMIYRILFGTDAKTIREERGIPQGGSIRPYLSDAEIKTIEFLQRTDIGLLFSIPDFTERKETLTKIYTRRFIA